MDTKQTRDIIRLIRGAYPDKQLTRETVEVYSRCLADLPFELAQGAVISHIAQNKWFPTIAELRQAAAQLVPGNRAPTALEAWGEITQQIQDVGMYCGEQYGRDLTFTHPAVERAVKAIGWRTLCLSENIMAERAHFLKLYDGYTERLREDAVQLPEVRRMLDAPAPELPQGKVGDNIRRLAAAKRLGDAPETTEEG